MKILNLLAITVFVALIVSCDSKNFKLDNPSVINIDFKQSKDIMDDVSSLYVMRLTDDSKYIPGRYSKVEWQGDYMYILDNSRGLYKYDSDGRIISSYYKCGQGPDEFLSISDFVLTDDGIILLDTYANPTLIFLDSDLNFQKKAPAEDKAAHFTIDTMGGIWYDRGNIAYNDNKDKLVYSRNNKRQTVLNVPKHLENITFSNSNSFCKFDNDTIAYLPVLEPYIYKCYNGETIKAIELDFGDRWPNIENNDKTIHPLYFMKKIAEDGKVYGLNIGKDGDNIVITFNCKDVFYIMMFRNLYSDSIRLFHVNSTQLEQLGSFLSVHKGNFYFGSDGRIVKLEL